MKPTDIEIIDLLINFSYKEFVSYIFNNKKTIHKNFIGNQNLLNFCCYYGLLDKYYAIINIISTKEKLKKINQTNIFKDNLLHYASISGRDNFIIIELIKNHIDPLDRNKIGESSIHLAGNKQIANYYNFWCYRRKIKVEDIIDNEGNTVLHTCYKYNLMESLKYWEQEYPHLLNVKNLNQETYPEVRQIKHHINKIANLK